MNRQDNNQESHFDEYAFDWWNKTGNYKLLHNLNPLRLDYVSSRFELRSKKILDIGCGGGIFSEELSRYGAKVTGIDSSLKSVNVAKQHAKENNLDIEYRNGSVLDTKDLKKYDCIVCFEMIEHINEPIRLIEKIDGFIERNTSVYVNY